MRLHLGVIDVPYKNGSNSDPKTTGDVATILEAKYHVMEHFWEAKKPEIAASLEQSMGDAIEALMMGATAAADPFTAAASDIEAKFKHFLSQRELDSLGYPGIPTKAAQNGVSHRFKHPYAKRAPRPSFIDTGTYEASFKVWVER